jgi:hypothetical protein
LKRITTVIAGALLAVGLTACSGVTTEADEVALRYEGSGAFEGRVDPTFIECLPPSVGDYGGMGDGTFTYPFGQQTLKFSDNPAEAPDFPALDVSAPSPGGGQPITMKTPVTIYYTPAFDNCDTLRQFHEKIGRKYTAWEPTGWKSMASRYLVDPTNLAVDRAALGYDWVRLTANETDKIAWENGIKLMLQGGTDANGAPVQSLIETVGGGGYFRIDAVTAQKPILPDTIQRAIADTESARQGKLTAEQFAAAARDFPGGPVEYQKFLDSQAIRDAIARGQVEVIPVPAGAGVNIGGSR